MLTKKRGPKPRFDRVELSVTAAIAGVMFKHHQFRRQFSYLASRWRETDAREHLIDAELMQFWGARLAAAAQNRASRPRSGAVSSRSFRQVSEETAIPISAAALNAGRRECKPIFAPCLRQRARRWGRWSSAQIWALFFRPGATLMNTRQPGIPAFAPY
jgi:hypothetical protein